MNSKEMLENNRYTTLIAIFATICGMIVGIIIGMTL